jgi:hypothetical protein
MSGKRKPWARLADMIVGRNADYHAVFDTEAGQRVLADLYDFCGVAKDDMPMGGDATGLHLANCAGKRRVALRIASMLNHDDDDLLRIAITGKPYEVDRGDIYED